METRASYLLVGGFTLVMMACLFGFVVWLAKSSFEEANSSRYHIYFTGSVIRHSDVPDRSSATRCPAAGVTTIL